MHSVHSPIKSGRSDERRDANAPGYPELGPSRAMAPQAELIGRTACDQAFERFRATGWNLGEFLAAAEQDAVPVTHDEPELADDELQELNDTQEGRYDPDDRNDSGIPKWPN